MTESAAEPSTDSPATPADEGRESKASQKTEGEDAYEEGSVLNEDAEALKKELDKITVEQPTTPADEYPRRLLRLSASSRIPKQDEFDPSLFPASYKENLPKEKLVLAFAENFRRQYVHLYRDRKPLFLNPINECRVEKFVCTTIKPTQLPYQELYDWDGAAEFVADYLNFVPLEPPYELPTRLVSPMTTLKQQKGNCFEYSMLLCSMLIGAGYDAYVVSGYASRETCLMDETREICPMLKKKKEMPKLLAKYFVPRAINKFSTKSEASENHQCFISAANVSMIPDLLAKYYRPRSVIESETPSGDKIREELAQVIAAEQKKVQKKYTVKPPKDLRSKFELMLEERKRKEIEVEEARKKKEEEELLAEQEKPPPDPLHGLRVHAWVLVLEGKREVPESFFIEPFTGIAHPVSSENYLGIETIWNHQNYWVNMQDCSEGVKNLRYDLGDCTLWEFMFPSNDKPQLTIPDEDDLMEGMDDEEPNKEKVAINAATVRKEEEEVEKHLDMPPSWVEPIAIDLKDFQMRCPHGKKEKYYKRAKLEKYAHYLMKDGLICRLSIFEDKELTDLTQIREYYANRADKLQERVFDHREGGVTEYYAPGRHRCLKEHQYKASAPGPENERTMIFYSEARVDGLVKRIETPTEMSEHFVDREDFLYYRFVEFGKRPKKFGPAENSTPRPILKMVEKYHRNRGKVANEDIAEIVFLISEEKIQLTYHTEDDKISASTREFMKPPNADEKGAMLVMQPDTHATFQIEPTKQQKKQVELYQMMVDLIKAEEKCKEKVRESEDEVQEILNDRTKEEVALELEISVYDTMRNEKAKKHRKELERLQLEEKMRKQEMELDYLAPFLAQIGNPEKLTRQQAYKLKEDCLADLKQRLIDKANLIQARFEKETQELQKKQSWYQQNQVSMQKDDEEEYLNYCSEAMFRIHILEVRLNRHRDIAPHKYMELEQKLRSDHRLAEYF